MSRELTLDLIASTLRDGQLWQRTDTFMTNIVNVFASTILVNVDNNINNNNELD